LPRNSFEPGKARLTAELMDRNGKVLCGAMYVKATRVVG
jgi:hypothetical protein